MSNPEINNRSKPKIMILSPWVNFKEAATINFKRTSTMLTIAKKSICSLANTAEEKGI